MVLLQRLQGSVRGRALVFGRRVTNSPPFPLADAIPNVATLRDRLDEVNYVAGPGLVSALYLALRLPQPLLLEGEAGVGKTEAAKAIAKVLDTPLIRLQCYQGLDLAEALYEWNYPRQLLSIRLAESRRVSGGTAELAETDLFNESFLVERPVLAALRHPGPRPAVLLIDEVDRADHDFEAFLLEVLAEAAVTIPEIGTITAAVPPIVLLTSNRTRDLHDALKRRCLYHWIDYPATDQMIEIVRRRVPHSSASLAHEVATAVARLRSVEVEKPPGIADSIDWVAALSLLGVDRLTTDSADATLGSVLKYRDDIDLVRERGLDWLVGVSRG